MNTATRPPCQTSGRRRLARFAWFFCLAAALLSSVAPTPLRSDEPPAWQRELESVRLAGVTLALLPPEQRAGSVRRLDELYRQLARKYPDQVAVRKAAGDHFWRTGETGPATAEWLAAQRLDPSDADTASALGSARLREGEVRLAREQFQRAVDARPAVASYHFDLANVLFLFRRQLAGTPGLPDEDAAAREALSQLRRACDLAPQNVDYALAYAQTFYAMRDPDWGQAFAAWERVRELSAAAPEHADSHLARISLYQGKPAQMEEYLALIHDPGFTRFKATLRRQAAEMASRAAKPADSR